MATNPQSGELGVAVGRLVSAFKQFSDGSCRIEEVTLRHCEVLKLLRSLPGSVLLTPAGVAIWERLLSAGQDQETAVGIADDLAEVLTRGTGLGSGLQFVDDTFTVWLDGVSFPSVDPLAYAVLKVLHAWRGRWVKTKNLVGYLDDPNLVRGRASEMFPPVDDTPAGRRRISRALKRLPPALRMVIRGNRNGRRISST